MKTAYLQLLSCIVLTMSFSAVQATNRFDGGIPDSIANSMLKQFDNVIIRSITVTGQKITKPKFVTRFLGFEEGDEIRVRELAETFKRSQKTVYNTGQFNSVAVYITKIEAFYVDVEVRIKERWYYMPYPIFDVVAPNFNTWWVDQNRDPGRLIYGAGYKQNNVRGRGEQLEISFNLGLNQNFEFEYDFPFINKKQTIGFSLSAQYTRSRLVNYVTVAHKQQSIDENKFQIRSLVTGAEVFYQNKLYDKHTLGLFYESNTISDTVQKLNYRFLNGRQRQSFFNINYSYDLDKRDNRGYPLDGFRFGARLEKFGLGVFQDVNFANIFASIDVYQPLGRGFYYSQRLAIKTSFPRWQPFFNQEGLGHSEYVRGYEYYVIDGQHYALAKINFKKRLFQTAIAKRGKVIKDERFNNLPIASYMKAYVDLGYVGDNYHDQYESHLDNQFLIGWGVGFDWPIFYDITIRTEYTWSRSYQNGNKFIQQGFFLHFETDI